MKVELAKQLDELYVVFGLRCLSVLRYLTDHIGVLSLGVLARSFSKIAQSFIQSMYHINRFSSLQIQKEILCHYKLRYNNNNFAHL